jgi:menaquinone-9 beta-reductase
VTRGADGRHDAEIIVVGGGPAGASCAWFLAHEGFDVLLLDRARFPRDKPCSEYLSPQASRVLSEMGVLERVEQAGAAQLAGMKVRAPNGAIIHGEFVGDHGFRGFRDRGLALRRTVLDAILLDRAREGGARVQEQTRVTGLLGDRARGFDGVTVMDTSGHKRDLRAQLIIGADGLRSVVARRAGLARASRWPRRIALVTHYRGIDDVGELGEMHVDPAGYMGIAAVGADEINVAVVVPISRAADIAVDPTDFLESWISDRPHLAPRFANATRTTPVRATGPFASSVTQAWAPGLALVGDAADFFDPFTGEGIYTALRGGELLAPFAAESVRAASTARARAALRAYDRSRYKEFRGKWMVERLIGTAVSFPLLLNRAARVLSRRRDMADLLVGVAGDFVPAREVLHPRYFLGFLLPATRPTFPQLDSNA